MTRYFSSLWGLAIFIAIWQLWVVVGNVPIWLLPAPSDVLVSLINDIDLLLFNARYTLMSAMAGFVLATALGVMLALVMDYWVALRTKLYPLLVLSQTVPIITLAPLIIIWFGYGLLPKVLVVTLVCFFPITVSVISGMQAVDSDLIDLMKVMGAGRWQIIKKARIPASLPSFFSGLRISATYCVMASVIGEWLGASNGLGVVLTRASHSFQMGRVFAAITAIVVLSMMLFLLVEVLARVTVPWHYRGER